ncbi:MAG: type II secretion system F family protein [Gaiellaceae bacterium]
MRLGARIAATSVALAALVLPAFALGQAGAPTLQEERGSSFPDKRFVLRLPDARDLKVSQVDVTENGGPVLAMALEAPGGSASGAVLLIDASKSMRGAPIEGAMDAARAFLAQRKDDLPVAIVTFGGGTIVLTDFTTDDEILSAAVKDTPRLSEGTVINDAIVRATELTTAEGLGRTTFVLLSDGADSGSTATHDEAVSAANGAGASIVSVGLQSPVFEPTTLQSLAQETGGTYRLAANVGALEGIFSEISSRVSSEYILSYRSLVPADTEANVKAVLVGLPAAAAVYTTPAIDVAPGGTFDRTWVDEVIISPWLMVFVLVAMFALLAFAVLSVVEVRRRSLRRRMAQYVSVPSEDESRARRAEVAAMLAEKAQSKVGGHRWWQRFETDVDLGGFRLSPLAIAGWTLVGGLAASIVTAVYFESFWGLLAGLAAPFVTRFLVSRKVTKARAAFDEQLPDNLDVLAGALRTGHSMMGALSVMVDSAGDPSKAEFRRVLQDEQLGVPLDDAIMVMARRMESYDAEQVAMVMRLQREAGGNTAEVLDRVAETIRGRMELRRLVSVLTAQARISRWILTALPIFVFVMLAMSGGDYLDPMLGSLLGRVALVVGGVMILIGSFWIKKLADLDV